MKITHGVFLQCPCPLFLQLPSFILKLPFLFHFPLPFTSFSSRRLRQYSKQQQASRSPDSPCPGKAWIRVKTRRPMPMSSSRAQSPLMTSLWLRRELSLMGKNLGKSLQLRTARLAAQRGCPHWPTWATLHQTQRFTLPREPRPASDRWPMGRPACILHRKPGAQALCAAWFPGRVSFQSAARLPTPPDPSGESQPRASRGRRPDPVASSSWVSEPAWRGGRPTGHRAAPHAPPGPLTACTQSFLAYPIHAKAQTASSQTWIKMERVSISSHSAGIPGVRELPDTGRPYSSLISQTFGPAWRAQVP